MVKKCFSIVGAPLLFLLFSLCISKCYSKPNDSEFDAIIRTYRSISGNECQIPKIQNGSFIVTGTQPSKTTSKIGPITNGAIVSFKCDLNFTLNTEYSNITCESGMWDNSVPKCVRTCRGFANDFIELTCELNDKAKNCSQTALEGTIMKMACIQHYVDVSNSSIKNTVCQNGTWNRPFLVCIPDCGKRIGKGQTYVVKGINAPEGEFPWHVAVYVSVNDTATPIVQCGGSIVTTKSVISAAHCFTYANNGTRNGYKYYVGAGKYYSTYNEPEEGEQIRKVSFVAIPDLYKGEKTTYTRDIAILILEDVLIITQKIQPICIDWNTKYEDQTLVDNNIGEVVGWGKTTPDTVDASIPLKLLRVPFISEKKCIDTVPENYQKFIAPDKICAGFSKMGKSVCEGDSGGGLVFPVEQGKIKTYYIRGLVSSGPQTAKHQCDTDHYAVYTKVSSYLPFIKEVHKAYNITTSFNTTSVLIGGCSAPEIINGRLILSEFTYLPRTIVPNQSIITAQCDDGYSLFPPTSLYLTCSFGKWNRPPPYCYVCGQRYNQTQQQEDSVSNVPELPWHVAIYRSYNGTRYFFGCGGTILSPNLVLTDENCFPRKQPKNGIAPEFEVIAAKYYSEDIIDEKKVEHFEQSRFVTTNDIRYGDHLAIAIIKTPFELNQAVQPICVDWEKNFELDQLDPRRNGTVASWSPVKYGHEKNQTVTDYQYERIENCLKGSSNEQIRDLIEDKFCVGHINGTVELCQANQGSGLGFINAADNRYFLRGVAVNVFGSRLYCNGKEFNAFLKVSDHFQFVLKVIDDYFARI